jgi:REP element-mobilizing transposase RayT
MGIEVKRMSELIRLSHNVSVLMYHYVCPAKYRRVVFDARVDEVLREICLGIEDRYDIHFLEIGTDKDHVHFLVQALPKRSPTEIIQTIKSITAREIFLRCPEVKKILWGGEFWSDGYYVSTVSQHVNEEVISKYVQRQGKEKEYRRLLYQQLKLFE